MYTCVHVVGYVRTGREGDRRRDAEKYLPSFGLRVHQSARFRFSTVLVYTYLRTCYAGSGVCEINAHVSNAPRVPRPPRPPKSMLDSSTTDQLKQKWAFIYLGSGPLTRTWQSNIECGGAGAELRYSKRWAFISHTPEPV